MNNSNVYVVFCNCPDVDSAQRIAQGLIEARLAACVNQLAAVISTYRWNDRTETATEVPLIIKTTAACYPALQDWIKQAHPYDTPEIIALPVQQGLPEYLNWVNEETEIPQ